LLAVFGISLLIKCCTLYHLGSYSMV